MVQNDQIQDDCTYFTVGLGIRKDPESAHSAGSILRFYRLFYQCVFFEVFLIITMRKFYLLV